LSERVQIALSLVRESDSITRSSVSSCLSASRVAPSYAWELGVVPVVAILILIFPSLPSAYHTLIPAAVLSHPFMVAVLPVPVILVLPFGSNLSSILVGFFSGW